MLLNNKKALSEIVGYSILIVIAIAFLAGLVIPIMLGWYQVATGTSPSSTLLGLASHEATALGASVVETQGERLLRAYGSLSHSNDFGGLNGVGLYRYHDSMRDLPCSHTSIVPGASFFIPLNNVKGEGVYL